jgi:hypothetical protein
MRTCALRITWNASIGTKAFDKVTTASQVVLRGRHRRLLRIQNFHDGNWNLEVFSRAHLPRNGFGEQIGLTSMLPHW